MNLVRRLASAAVLIAVVAAGVWIGGIPLLVLALAAVAVAAWELGGLTRAAGAAAPLWLLAPLALVLAARLLLPAAWPVTELVLAAAVVAGLLGCLLLRISFTGWAAAVAGALYLGIGVGCLLGLRATGSTSLGIRLVVLALAGPIVGDTVAYFAGSAIGRHRFFAHVSPKKSVEGAVAGALATVVALALLAHPLAGWNPVWGALLGAGVTVAAQGGDLAESALKRQAQVKDSSRLIPGHGGLLDRLDSILLVAPVVYWFARWITPG